MSEKADVPSKGLSWRALVCIAALGCGACYSESPLDPTPQVDPEPRLLGEWRCLSMDPDSPSSARVTLAADRDSPGELDVTWQEDAAKPESYVAFPSRVGASSFLNVRSADEGPLAGEWAFVRYSFPRRNLLALDLVPSEVFEDQASSQSPAAARATLEGALETTPGLLQPFCVCVRIASRND
jgi:hypothetical protein